ncbi:MAG TPA: adenylate/guanylate cyclase domain-containing protein [Bacteroidota bacterium]|nr:adenylate/guanylate cyclase domain-containing protein [Bacteroidota bacterium]
MYKSLLRKTYRAVLIGTSLAVLPAVPFYSYTFDASPGQLAILVPLFIPALVAMLLCDLLLIRLYGKPIAAVLSLLEAGRPADDLSLARARQRALNFPAFAVVRVFLPHAIVGSGVFNLCIILGNKYLGLGIDPGDFLMYWAINLTVVPVAHAVYEYFALSKAVIPVLQRIDSEGGAAPRASRLKVIAVGLATKVIVIFLMLGIAPLLILGISLNKKHTSLLVEKEGRHLERKVEMLLTILPSATPPQRSAIFLSAAREGLSLLIDSAGRREYSGAPLDSADRLRLLEFARNGEPGPGVMSDAKLLAAKSRSSDGGFAVAAAASMNDLLEESASLRTGTVSIIVVSLLLLAGLLTLVAKDINDSTKALVAGLRQVEEGSLDNDVRIYSTDEFSTIGDGFNRMIAGLKERNFIKDTFGKYVAPTVMEKILRETKQGGGEFRLGGERRRVTILISDIRDFTQRTEESSAEAIVELLNRYLEKMVAVVERYDGTVDKYIGDALMVLFGAPIAREDDPDRALQTAFAMRDELAGLNRDLRGAYGRSFDPIRIGIGIHTGEVVAGSLGSTNRLEYTVIGDAVNLASRIEGLTKVFGTDILVSEETMKELKGRYPLERLPKTRVKGKKGDIVVYRAGRLRPAGKRLS